MKKQQNFAKRSKIKVRLMSFQQKPYQASTDLQKDYPNARYLKNSLLKTLSIEQWRKRIHNDRPYLIENTKLKYKQKIQLQCQSVRKKNLKQNQEQKNEENLKNILPKIKRKKYLKNQKEMIIPQQNTSLYFQQQNFIPNQTKRNSQVKKQHKTKKQINQRKIYNTKLLSIKFYIPKSTQDKQKKNLTNYNHSFRQIKIIPTQKNTNYDHFNNQLDDSHQLFNPTNNVIAKTLNTNDCMQITHYKSLFQNVVNNDQKKEKYKNNYSLTIHPQNDLISRYMLMYSED